MFERTLEVAARCLVRSLHRFYCQGFLRCVAGDLASVCPNMKMGPFKCVLGVTGIMSIKQHAKVVIEKVACREGEVGPRASTGPHRQTAMGGAVSGM